MIRPAKAKRTSTAPDRPWHALPGPEVLEGLDSRADGLTGTEVKQRWAEYGPNALPSGGGLSFPRVVLRQFMSPLIYVLIAAGVLSAVIGDVKDTVFIFLVVVINAAFGTFQEYRAEKGAAALQDLVKTYVSVRRDGARVEVDSEELVPGDVMLLESGRRVPADARLLEANGLTVDESALTGESVASAKEPGTIGKDTTLGDRINTVFAGTMVTSGRGVAVVYATGLGSELGRITGAVVSAKPAKPPLVIRMESFARTISVVVLVVGIALAGLSVARGYAPAEAFFFAIALAVSAIPEGLPVGITVALSVGTRRMSKRNVVVRELAAVEGLGSCTCIASDKTGTLTLNSQTARLVWLPGSERLKVSGEGYSGQGGITTRGGAKMSPGQEMLIKGLAEAAALDNEASLERRNEEWSSAGDAVEIALLALCLKAGLEPASTREQHPVVGGMPFESQRRFSASVYQTGGGNSVVVKGSVEALLPFCESMLSEEGKVDLARELVTEEANALAAEGYRIIAVARGDLEGDLRPEDFTEEEMPPLALLGLVGLIDPLRPEARDAVARCAAAGIQVVMVTGDHPATALAIARELGIAESEDEVTTGDRLMELGEPCGEHYREAVASSRVFARVSPLQKVSIVECLMALGHFVAVTGDGVNDAPALKTANIGVAMGTGTDVAKEVASIIVTDDDFASIVAGVEEGRYAYDNIRKVIWLLVSQGLAEVILFAAVIIAGLPLALVAIQILWLNLVTNGVQHIALALEPGEQGTMLKPPRSPGERVFNSGMILETCVAGFTIGAVGFGVWYYLLNGLSMEEAAARNLLLLLMVLFENIHVFNCRSESISAFKIPIRRNLFLLFAVFAAQGVQLLAMHVGFLRRLLETSPVSPATWLYLLLISCSVLLAVEVYKGIRGRWWPRLPETGGV